MASLFSRFRVNNCRECTRCSAARHKMWRIIEGIIFTSKNSETVAAETAGRSLQIDVPQRFSSRLNRGVLGMCTPWGKSLGNHSGVNNHSDLPKKTTALSTRSITVSSPPPPWPYLSVAGRCQQDLTRTFWASLSALFFFNKNISFFSVSPQVAIRLWDRNQDLK